MSRNAVLPFAAVLDPMNAPQGVLHILDDDLLQILLLGVERHVDGVVRRLVLVYSRHGRVLGMVHLIFMLDIPN